MANGKAGKPKILHEGRISVMREGGESTKLTPDEQKTINSLQREQDGKDRRKVASKLTHKGRPLPEHIQKAIEEASQA